MGGFTPMEVVFDTGSDWLVAQGTSCTSCSGHLYNPSVTGRLTNDTLSSRSYGSAVLNGTTYKDTVCLDMSICVVNFEYFSISE